MSYGKKKLLSLLASSLLTFSCAAVHAQTITIPKKGESPTIDRIVSSGVLNAGAAILSPWLLQDPKTGKYIGPVALISEDVAKALNVKLEYVPATWDTLIAGLLAKKYELAAAAILATPEREKVIGFVNFGYSGTCYVVRPDSPIRTLADLNNPKLLYLGYVGLANGTMFHKKYPKTKMQMITPPPGYGPRVDEVLGGRGDIAAIDSPLAFWVNHKWPKARLIPSPAECLKHPDLNRTIGVGYPKGDKVFEKFLTEVVAANQIKIDASIEHFSQPEWLNKR